MHKDKEDQVASKPDQVRKSKNFKEKTNFDTPLILEKA